MKEEEVKDRADAEGILPINHGSSGIIIINIIFIINTIIKIITDMAALHIGVGFIEGWRIKNHLFFQVRVVGHNRKQMVKSIFTDKRRIFQNPVPKDVRK